MLEELRLLSDDAKPSGGGGTGGGGGGGARMTPSSSTGAPPARNVTDDLDALLDDLDFSGGGSGKKFAAAAAPQPKRVEAAAPKAAPPTSSVAAISFPSSADEHATSLRCTRCDFKVLRFTDKQWADDAEYMFFRNFMPDTKKLQRKLRARDDCTAYACQCCWANVELGEQVPVSNWFMSKAR